MGVAARLAFANTSIAITFNEREIALKVSFMLLLDSLFDYFLENGNSRISHSTCTGTNYGPSNRPSSTTWWPKKTAFHAAKNGASGAPLDDAGRPIFQVEYALSRLGGRSMMRGRSIATFAGKSVIIVCVFRSVASELIKIRPLDHFKW